MNDEQKQQRIINDLRSQKSSNITVGQDKKQSLVSPRRLLVRIRSDFA